MSNNQVVNPVQPSYLDSELDKIHEMYNHEVGKGTASNQDKMLEIALRIIVLVMYVDARNRHDYSNRMSDEARALLPQIQKTYTSAWGIAIAALTIGANLAAAACGFGGFMGLADPIAKSVQSAATGLGAAAQGLGGVSQLVDKSSERDRIGHQFLQTFAQKKEQEQRDAETQRINSAQGALRTMSEVFTSLHRAAEAAPAA